MYGMVTYCTIPTYVRCERKADGVFGPGVPCVAVFRAFATI